MVKGLKSLAVSGLVAGVQDAPIPILTVEEVQKRILELCMERPREISEIARLLGRRKEDLMRSIEELRILGLITVEKRQVEKLELTEEGASYLLSMLPEEKVAAVLEKVESVRLDELPLRAASLGLELKEGEARLGIMHLARAGAVVVRNGVVTASGKDSIKRALNEAKALRESLASIARGEGGSPGLLETLKRRKLVTTRKATDILVSLTEEGRRALAEGRVSSAKLVTTLTPQIVLSGEWKRAVFKEYDLTVPPPRVYPGRKHPYLEFLDAVRELLVSMGFEEMKGPHVELELWNFDALFQAQDHPAREIHDTFFLKNPTSGRAPEELLKKIGAVHESGGDTGSRGWGYRWDPSRALRLVLRTQTTAVSARTLYSRGDGEYRCFALDRVFRPENLDAKHSMEFYQLEGIIVSRRVTLRHLIGFFHELARALGLGPVKIKPAYFPFTEPSVEGYIKHEKLGWMEVFPGGMFRPEVLRPLGVKESNVAAWGIGIDRIAMAALGIDDIRLLFSQDLGFLRGWSPPLRW